MANADRFLGACVAPSAGKAVGASPSTALRAWLRESALKNERGVALLIVLGAIAMLTIAVVEFVTDTDIQMELAMNERDRLRAEYLAYSASNLMQLELQLEKSAKGLLANAPAAMTEGISSGPLCKQFPMSSALLRGVFLGESEPMGDAAKEGGEKPAGGAAAKEGPMITAFQQQAAQEFLSFVGDFDGQCEELQSRINLNSFFDLDPAQPVLAGSNPYDQLKLTIMALLQQPAYRDIIGETPLEQVKNHVRNVADWVDKNDQINELGGVVGGPETSLYGSEPGPQHRVKNGKMLSLDEVFLVEGVTDDWFGPFREMFTVYGEAKVNVCMADPDVVMALISRYAASNQRFATVDVNKPEMKEKLMAAVAMDCEVAQPQATKIAQDVDTILGGGTVAPQTGGTGTQQPAPAPTPSPTTPGQTTPSAVASNFAQMITTESRWYELKSTGQVGDVIVHLTQVWDTKDPNPRQWKMVFSKFE